MLGILIQGPLKTFGQGPNNSVEGFTCLQNIENQLSEIHKLKLKFHIVLCLWSRDKVEYRQFLDQFENRADILYINEPELKDKDHRYKHHYAIKSGLDYLNQYKPQWVIKLRTDQLLSYATISNILRRISKEDRLLVSEVSRENFYLGDFVYASRTAVFVDFIHSILQYDYHIMLSVANDIGYKYFIRYNKHKQLYFNNRNKIFLIVNAFLFYVIGYKENQLIQEWRRFLSDQVITLRREEWENIRWRNKLMFNIMPKTDYFVFDQEIVLCYPQKNGLKKFWLEFKRYSLKHSVVFSAVWRGLKSIKDSLLG